MRVQPYCSPNLCIILRDQISNRVLEAEKCTTTFHIYKSTIRFLDQRLSCLIHVQYYWIYSVWLMPSRCANFSKMFCVRLCSPPHGLQCHTAWRRQNPQCTEKSVVVINSVWWSNELKKRGPPESKQKTYFLIVVHVKNENGELSLEESWRLPDWVYGQCGLTKQLAPGQLDEVLQSNRSGIITSRWAAPASL